MKPMAVLRSTYRRGSWHVVALLWLAALLGSVGAADARQPDAVASQPWQSVQQYMAAWNAHDAQGATQALAADVTYFNTSAAAPREGRDAVRHVVEGLLGLIPDLHWQVIGEPVAQGDGIAFEWEFSGNARLPDDASHTEKIRPIRLRGASFARVEHGRIVYFADYYNGQAMHEQLAP